MEAHLLNNAVIAGGRQADCRDISTSYGVAGARTTITSSTAIPAALATRLPALWACRRRSRGAMSMYWSATEVI